ncbi:MAG: response regulator [Verrucomicrobia bacterium]|nr:response regulator [Verrucomicrobiota bacterium]
MKPSLHVLMIEDSAADAEILERQLGQAGWTCHVRRVATKDQFLRELHQRVPDVILSDHGLPAFDGFTALAIARMQCPDTPFIFVTGAAKETLALETLQSGAADYILKHRLETLGSAVHRALREAEERARRRQAEAECARLLKEARATRAKFEAMRALLFWP